jgi:hypothetical protein
VSIGDEVHTNVYKLIGNTEVQVFCGGEVLVNGGRTQMSKLYIGGKEI